MHDHKHRDMPGMHSWPVVARGGSSVVSILFRRHVLVDGRGHSLRDMLSGHGFWGSSVDVYKLQLCLQRRALCCRL